MPKFSPCDDSGPAGIQKEDEQARCHALMMFSGEDLDSDSVSNLLALQPSHARKKGDPMARPRPDRPTPLARRGGISYSTYKMIVSADVNDHLRYLLNAVLPVSEQLKALVDRDHLHWGIVLFIDDAPSDWRSLLEKAIADTLDSLGIELILDDPSTITVVEESQWCKPDTRYPGRHPRLLRTARNDCF